MNKMIPIVSVNELRNVVETTVNPFDEKKKLVNELLDHQDLHKMTAEEMDDLFKALEEAGYSGPSIRAAVMEAGSLEPVKFWQTMETALHSTDWFSIKQESNRSAGGLI